MASIKPLGDRVVVEPKNESEEKIGSIIVPDTAKEKPQEGKIIAVGQGRYEDGKLIPLEVKVGDTVLYGKYSGTEIKQGGRDLLIIRESDILGVVTN
ncbi:MULTISPECIES: co-chaperone GroES [Leptospira]|uniref:Co-chaperonin GroES n=4 Tax=Leptospira TaxID=171 RepID=N1VND2_9LEPT|nr:MULTISPECIES: co-chaperone GroES [Leptospira]EMY59953.1 chaperonin GroS [Leptospira terpstrae serovar Hualin str. LT 11-33 = ATCC 700639]EMY70397.1 chaperonin GroS [Leptospira vanthielii serovar Holland str. Waz Holland = ATCC 700522]EOQ97801.1 chaperonin GroS [Leptospira wolbachii serovar Codice str. CDC]MBM9546007.1 co-chaperone GroES [Leptospira abararensis]MBM9592066.1 co-chaperone GroES [Leptospira chreensis]